MYQQDLPGVPSRTGPQGVRKTKVAPGQTQARTGALPVDSAPWL